MHRLYKPVLCVLLTVAACAPATSPDAELSSLPPYTSIEASLFDDSIASEVFGFPGVEVSSANAASTLSARATEAEFIGEVRVATVTRDGTGDRVRYTLTMAPAATPLKGHVDGTIEVMVTADNPSFSVVRAEDTGLVNKHMYLMMKRFDERGEISVHFRAEPSTPAMLERLRRALAMDELANEN